MGGERGMLSVEFALIVTLEMRWSKVFEGLRGCTKISVVLVMKDAGPRVWTTSVLLSGSWIVALVRDGVVDTVCSVHREKIESPKTVFSKPYSRLMSLGCYLPPCEDRPGEPSHDSKILGAWSVEITRLAGRNPPPLEVWLRRSFAVFFCRCSVANKEFLCFLSPFSLSDQREVNDVNEGAREEARLRRKLPRRPKDFLSRLWREEELRSEAEDRALTASSLLLASFSTLVRARRSPTSSRLWSVQITSNMAGSSARGARNQVAEAEIVTGR